MPSDATMSDQKTKMVNSSALGDGAAPRTGDIRRAALLSAAVGSAAAALAVAYRWRRP